MVRKELDYFFRSVFAPKRQKSLVKQGILPQVVKTMAPPAGLVYDASVVERSKIQSATS